MRELIHVLRRPRPVPQNLDVQLADMAGSMLINDLEQQRPYRCHGIPSSAKAARPRGGGLDASRGDHNVDVDQSDFGLFQRCYSGEGNPVDLNCAN